MAHWDPNFGSCDPGGSSYSGNIPLYNYGYQNYNPPNSFVQNHHVPIPSQNMYTVQEIESNQRQRGNTYPLENSNSLHGAVTSMQALNLSATAPAPTNFNLNAAEFKPMDVSANDKTKGAVKKSTNAHNDQSGSKTSNRRNEANFKRYDNRNSKPQHNNYKPNSSSENYQNRNQQRNENRGRHEYYNSRYDQSEYNSSKPNYSQRNKNNQAVHQESTSRENKRWANNGRNVDLKKSSVYERTPDRYQDRFAFRRNKSTKNEEKEIENWRSYAASYTTNKNGGTGLTDVNNKIKQVNKLDNNEESHHKEKSKNHFAAKEYKKKVDAASQRERLTEQIKSNVLECLVCCERIRKNDMVWNCRQCFHVFHLNCVSRWARSSCVDETWRCPACQFVLKNQPFEYVCFCGGLVEPPPDPGHLAHSCGELCSRKPRPGCVHACTLLCHPGPCPECNAVIKRSCCCETTTVSVKCSDRTEVKCDAACKKLLNCELHYCSSKCHEGDCSNCEEMITQDCFCTKHSRTIPCTVHANSCEHFECGDECKQQLSCGNHACTKLCHPGTCDTCEKAPETVKSCPCGQSPLVNERKSCLDPIPTCDKICGNKLRCGQPSEPHTCISKCHHGACPPCKRTTSVRCRCGHMDREIACSKVNTAADDARCEKKCTKKRSCGKHKCNQLCCIELDHECPLPCNHQLTCGIHRCERTCHPGRCLPCSNTSFEELYCECGASVIYPPVPCGTRKPACRRVCVRDHPCSHPPQHNCHSLPKCPPCTQFTSKSCHGGHEIRNTIPCHQLNFSCGMPCGKDLECGTHKCNAVCHLGPCPQPCVQPCGISRITCGHICGQPCHEGQCPETPCKQTVRVTCECGHRSSSRACAELAGEYQRIATSLLADKMVEMQRGHSVDIGDIVATPSQRKQSTLKTLECNDECRIIDRNRRLAIGLQIRNPDLSAKLTPRYTDYMRQWARKDSRFCQMVHDKLTELVQLAKQSKQKSRSYSFECMNKDKRHFVHECCEHFGCESAAYDQEPNRNVVVTAARDKAWLPSISLLELLQRENGQRKVPGPIMSRPTTSAAVTKTESISLKLPPKPSSRAAAQQRPSTPPGEYVDYFNDPPV